jgi:hypothetical protein
MGRWSRSWALARMSFGVIGKDKEMLLFPLMSAICSVVFAVAMLFPTLLVHVFDDGSPRFGVVDWFLMFIVYTGFAFGATFCNTCVVYTTKVRLEGGNPTFMQSIRFALSRTRLLISWSVVAATAGVILGAIDSLAERMPLVGRILLGILRVVLGVAWSIMTVFVIPILVFENVGPFEAIRRSSALVRQTWGENLRRLYTLGLVQFLLVVPVFIGLYLLIGLAGSQPQMSNLVAVAVVIALLYFFVISYVFGVANTVYKAALYVYARESRVPDGFSADVLQGAFQSR